jgi:hypothetical protein
MSKEFKSNINKPTDAEVHAFGAGRPFKKCPSCGQSIGPKQPYCWECKRLVELGMKDAVKQPVGVSDTSQDTQEKQSNPSHNHSGYRDQISSKKFPPNKERV